jgi:excisionase family DNA binding protein
MSSQVITLKNVLDRIDILTNAVLSNKQTLTMEEAAAFIGVAVSYLYKLTSSQQIPHFKPRGKMIYFDRAELEEWLRQGRVSSIGDIDRKAADHVVGGA